MSRWALISVGSALLACQEPQGYLAVTRPEGARSALTVIEAPWGTRRGAADLEVGRPDALLDLELEGPNTLSVIYLDAPLEQVALALPPAAATPEEPTVPLDDFFLSGLQLTYRDGAFGESRPLAAQDLSRFPFLALAEPCPWYTRAFTDRFLSYAEAQVVGLVAVPEWNRFVAVEGNGRILYLDGTGAVTKEIRLGVGATAATFGAWSPGPNRLLVTTSTGTLLELGPNGEELANQRLSPVALTGVAYGTLAGLDRTAVVDARGWVYGRDPEGEDIAEPSVPFAPDTDWKVVISVGEDALIYSETYGAFRVTGPRLAVASELTPGPEHRLLTAAFSEQLGMLAVVAYPRHQPEERYFLRQRGPDGSAWTDYPLTDHANDVRDVVPGEQGWMIAGALGIRAGMVGLLEELRPQSRCRSIESTLTHKRVARLGQRILSLGEQTTTEVEGYYLLSP